MASIPLRSMSAQPTTPPAMSVTERPPTSSTAVRRPALLDRKVRLVLRVRQVPRDRRDLLVRLVLRVRRAILARLALVPLAPLVPQDPRVAVVRVAVAV